MPNESNVKGKLVIRATAEATPPPAVETNPPDPPVEAEQLAGPPEIAGNQEDAER
jgi:hypothetical protein